MGYEYSIGSVDVEELMCCMENNLRSVMDPQRIYRLVEVSGKHGNQKWVSSIPDVF